MTTDDIASRVTITPMTTAAESLAFKQLNEEWIVELFEVEPTDRMVLNDPSGQIVEKGGHILIARLDGSIVGCVALISEGSGIFELSKMAVDRSLRGRGVGRRVLEDAIEYARAIGAATLYLESNSKLANAVHLYESVGFEHVRTSRHQSAYGRSNVFMEYRF